MAETPITLYADDSGYTLIDHPTHVEMQDGAKMMVLVSTIYDDGENVGPENIEAVCPNIETAHCYIERRFVGPHMRVERCDDDPLSSYRLFFTGFGESNMTLWCRLVPLEEC